MRVRLQKRDITKLPAYEKAVGTVFVFDDQDQVLFAVLEDQGGYRFLHRGQPDFAKAVKEFLNIDLPAEELVDIKP